MNYMFLPLKRYADFSGRSRRLEFWLWTLFNMIIVGVLCAFVVVSIFSAIADLGQRAAGGEFANYVPTDSSSGSVEWNGEKYAVPPQIVMQTITGAFGIPGLLLGIYWLAVFIPNLAVQVRRMHDQDKSGWWILIAFVPLIGGIWLLILFLIDGTRGPNRFGPDPKARPADAQAFV